MIQVLQRLKKFKIIRLELAVVKCSFDKSSTKLAAVDVVPVVDGDDSCADGDIEYKEIDDMACD